MAIIESTAEAKEAANHIAAIEEIIENLRAAQALAISNKDIGHLTAEHLKALAPVEQATANLRYERKQLEQALQDWGAVENINIPASATTVPCPRCPVIGTFAEGQPDPPGAPCWLCGGRGKIVPIAAAPELVEALEKMLADCPPSNDCPALWNNLAARELARAALLAARGNATGDGG